MSNIRIQAFPSGPFATNAYVVACTRTKRAMIIDPSLDSFASIQSYLKNHALNLEKILLTHSHWDHIADVKRFKDEYQIPVYIHSLDAPNLREPGIDKIPIPCVILGVQPDILIKEGMQVECGELLFDVLHTPGHSPGCVCFYEITEQQLFSGDTLFKGAMGSLSLPTSQPELMSTSLEKLAQLPVETKVYPGHGRETTIKDELSWMKKNRGEL